MVEESAGAAAVELDEAVDGSCVTVEPGLLNG